tara:strand:+ start:575 stop:1132 length:558 start_codon:yes stop_codon:yes gene_type:complete
MRIIAGQFKGRKILEPTDKTTRPLKDLVKESIFNIINHSRKLNLNLKNSNVLDLFSGVGSFGLEALSREASNVIFVENYLVSLLILKKNVENLKLEEKCKIIDADIFNDFDFKTLKKKIDIIFLDPPFKEKNISLILSKIKEAKILDSKGIIIIHRNFKENEIFQELKIVEEKKYGLSKILFCKF